MKKEKRDFKSCWKKKNDLKMDIRARFCAEDEFHGSTIDNFPVKSFCRAFESDFVNSQAKKKVIFEKLFKTIEQFFFFFGWFRFYYNNFFRKFD